MANSDKKLAPESPAEIAYCLSLFVVIAIHSYALLNQHLPSLVASLFGHVWMFGGFIYFSRNRLLSLYQPGPYRYFEASRILNPFGLIFKQKHLEL